MRCRFISALPGVTILLVLGSSTPATAQVNAALRTQTRVSLSQVSCPRIADPKLDGGAIPISFTVQPNGVKAHVSVRLLKNGAFLDTLYSGDQIGSDLPHTYAWDGRLPIDGNNASRRFVDPASYTIEIIAGASNLVRAELPLNIVRLGITEIEAQPSNGNNEWQMVYFRKGASSYAFFATPAIHEYLNVAETGEIADLDLDSGEPRPPAPVHTATDTPPLEGSEYEDDRYNFPVCYLGGSQPRFEITMGATCVSQSGTAIGCGYPVAGYQIRGVASDESGAWQSQSDDIQPGGKAVLLGPALSDDVTREDRTITWTWQYRAAGETEWRNIAGQLQTEHRFYLTVGVPLFASTSGTQHVGPWVEVAEYSYQWRRSLTSTKTGADALVDVFMKGFFGQNGYIPTAIEGVVYDCPSMGGDGGATHYFSFATVSVSLSRLLNSHASGKFVNCSDVAACTSTMLGMLGVQNVQMLRLGSMTLRAIWGIGTPDYTDDLWGNGHHGFSYHHIITRDGGAQVSDSCMWLDEDGNPNNLPGSPGYNCDRPWNTINGVNGYEELAASNNVTKSLDPLPTLK